MLSENRFHLVDRARASLLKDLVSMAAESMWPGMFQSEALWGNIAIDRAITLTMLFMEQFTGVNWLLPSVLPISMFLSLLIGTSRRRTLVVFGLVLRHTMWISLIATGADRVNFAVYIGIQAAYN